MPEAEEYSPEEVADLLAESREIRRPAPPPIPVRGRFYLVQCRHCEWVGSSEQCGSGGGPDHDDIICPVCCDAMAPDFPSEAETAKHGEAVLARILKAEAALFVARSRMAGGAKHRVLNPAFYCQATLTLMDEAAEHVAAYMKRARIHA